MGSKDGEDMIENMTLILSDMKPKKERTSYLKQKRNKNGRFGKKKLTLWTIIKKWFGSAVILFFITSCARYQVVQELEVNMYHLHNPRSHKMEVILTKQKLEIGKWYKLKSIDIIEIEK